MKSITITLLGLAATAVPAIAQDISSLPTCAQSCITSTLSSSSCSSISDSSCICSSTFITPFTSCVESSCDSADQATTKTLADEHCASVGVAGTAATASTASSPSTPATAVAISSAYATGYYGMNSSVPAATGTGKTNGTYYNSTSSPISPYTGGAGSKRAEWVVGGLGAVVLGAVML